jgi:hypothetical protein
MDLFGYNWGNRSKGKGKINVPVTLGTTNQIYIKLGQLKIGLNKPNGSPNVNTYIAIYTQRTDVNNKQKLNEKIREGRTDNGGFAVIDQHIDTLLLKRARRLPRSTARAVERNPARGKGRG